MRKPVRKKRAAFQLSRAVTADTALSARIKQEARIGPKANPSSAGAALDLALVVKPGKERWPVKTGQDSGASKVGAVAGSPRPVIVDTTIEELVEMARPSDMRVITKNHPQFQKRRATPVEITVWRITAHVTGVKNEDDGDLHLILQGESGATMIAEAPRAEKKFVGAGNPWLPAMRRVRETIDPDVRTALSGTPLIMAASGEYVPIQSFDQTRLSAAALSTQMDAAAAFDAGLKFKARIAPRRARLAGVGFFDRVHGQTGVASTNGIELHPLFEFEWLTESGRPRKRKRK